MTWFEGTLGGLTGLALGFTLVTHVALALHRRKQIPSVAPERVLLLRPVDAPSELEQRNLEAPLPPGVRQLVVGPPHSNPRCANRKVGHLLWGLKQAEPGEMVMSADADVRVTAQLLASLAGPVFNGAALTTASPQPLVERGLAARAVRGILSGTHQSFEAIEAVTLGARPVCGKAMAFGRAAIEELPGVSEHAGEDLELAQRLHVRGERVVLARVTASVPQALDLDLAAVLERFTRWMQVLRAHRPALFPTVLFLFAPTPPLLLAAGALHSAWFAGLVAALLVSRIALAVRLSPEPGLARTWEWLLGEAVLLAAFFASLTRRNFVWRGRVLTLHRGGRLEARGSSA